MRCAVCAACCVFCVFCVRFAICAVVSKGEAGDGEVESKRPGWTMQSE